MKFRKLLYFEGVNLNPKNMAMLKKFFLVKNVRDVNFAKRLNFFFKDEVWAIYCDQNFVYDSLFLKHFKNLKYLVSSTTSTDFIDSEYCKKNNICIISLQKEQKFLKTITSTAEHVLGLILLISRKYIPAIKSIEEKKFNRRPFGGHQMLSRSSIGIIGYGRLGKIVKKISKNIFKNVYTADTKMDKLKYKKNLEKIFTYCDYITLHIHSRGNTKFFDQKNLPPFKKNFFLINTSRGEVVNENFIIKLLSSKKILGYATDVLTGEFKRNFDIKKNIIFRNRIKYNIVITPHIGGSTIDAWNLTEKRVIESLIKKKI